MGRLVLSASRRTDIPAFYMPWFMQSVARGFFEVRNPYNRRTSRIAADAAHVHSIVFWSKNFGPLLQKGYGEQLLEKGYGLFFNFTINSAHAVLEPQVPPLNRRLAQLANLVRRFGASCVQWRFDPICHYRTRQGRLMTNLEAFDDIAAAAAGLGLTSCVTSFVDLYGKVRRRLDKVTEFTIYEPSLAQKIDCVRQLQAELARRGMTLRLCCEKEVLTALPQDTHIEAAACVPVHKLAALYGGDISLQPDPGQRTAAGCGCGVSRDIGSYDLHPCRHDCLFCYANPSRDGRIMASAVTAPPENAT